MFNFFFGKKKQGGKGFDPKAEIERLVEFSPPSALVYLLKSSGEGVEELGKAFFLRRDKKLYFEGTHIYSTTPENLKIATDQNLSSRNVSLFFFYRRVPHRIDCRVVGRFRLLPEIAETLDFHTQAAYKLLPIGPVKKQEKRQFLRYAMQNYGDTRTPLTTHVSFELYLRTTNHAFPTIGAPPMIINDLQPVPFVKPDGARQTFSTREAIAQFRALMLNKQPHERYISLSKIIKPVSTGMVRKPDTELVLGEVNVLALEMESLRDVLYLKKPAKSGGKKGQDDIYNLHEGEKIIGRFSHSDKYYEMLLEVVEARTQNEVVRPLGFIREESGLNSTLVNYSTGGLLIESSPELLLFVLEDKCPPIDETTDYAAPHWQKVFEELKSPIIHVTLYPKLHFPDAVRQFKPELPFKICLCAQIVRTHFNQVSDTRVILQHGLQFAYEPQGIPLHDEDIVPWRYIRHIKDNEHLRGIHSKLSQLYGYLENQSLTAMRAPRTRPEPPGAPALRR